MCLLELAVKFGGLDFVSDEGEWTEGDNSLKQSRVEGVSRCHAKTGKNFEVDVSIRIEGSAIVEGRSIGEAKIIFSEADLLAPRPPNAPTVPINAMF